MQLLDRQLHKTVHHHFNGYQDACCVRSLNVNTDLSGIHADFERQFLAPDHVSAVWYLSFSQEKLTMYSINNLYSGSSKDDKALTVRLPQLHKYLRMCLASESKPLAGTYRRGVSTQA